MPNTNTIPSGFPDIDAHAGGLLKGGVFLVKTLEQEGEELQDFMMAEIKQLAVESRLRVLVASLQMDERALAVSLTMNETPSGIKTLMNAEIAVMTKEKDDTWKDVLEDIEHYAPEFKADVVIIDGMDDAVPEPAKGVMDTSIIDGLLATARRTGLPLVVSDYDNKIEVGIHRDDKVTEMEIKTDIHDTVQAAVYSNDKETLIDDLYGLWKVFLKTLKE